ncbi:MAG: HU family DNA-binding protein [Kiritimatiellae bacterium]|nr:HU family DNA-binding protein [Kiritimatiellia bacterium]
MQNKSYTKLDLVREIAFTVGLTQKKVRFVLDALQFIAYREAANKGFTVPGLCRIDVVRRKERQVRNPQTGEKILIAEHNALRTRPIKKAKDAVTPAPEGLLTYLTSEHQAPKVYDDFSQAISFKCKNCGQEIEAPKAAVGIESECPACNMSITIPDKSEPGTMHGEALPEKTDTPPKKFTFAPTATPAAALSATEQPEEKTNFYTALQPAQSNLGKNQTIRIDLAALGMEETRKTEPKRMISFFCKNCRQEIEAPTDMAGSGCDCPSCGISFEVPFFSDKGTLHGSDLEHTESEIKNMKGRTIRIEVPDDF